MDESPPILRSETTSGRTYYHILRTSIQDRPSRRRATSKDLLHALGCLWRTRALLGKKNTHLLAAAVSKRATHQPTTLIKSYSVFYLIKMASSNCSLVYLLWSVLYNVSGCAVYTTLLFLTSFLLDASSVWLRMMDCSFFDSVFTCVDADGKWKGKIQSAAHILYSASWKEKMHRSTFGVDVSCTHSHLVLWNDIFSNKQTFFFFCILPLQLPHTTY